MTRAAAANLLCFEIRGQRFGCGIVHVKETIVVRPITRVFLTPPWVSGIINLRGDIVAVLDLAAYLGLGPTAIGGDTRIVIARSGGPVGLCPSPVGANAAKRSPQIDDRVAGLLVDRLAEVRAADLAALEPPPPTLGAEMAALMTGILTLPGGAPLGVLDLGKLFESDRLRGLARPTQGA